jgi:murein L,D-transpeptidase YafK
LALHISYPSAADVFARARGVIAGSDIEIHGLRKGLGCLGRWHRLMDRTHGCIALTDSETDEIWRAAPDGTPIVSGIRAVPGQMENVLKTPCSVIP